MKDAFSAAQREGVYRAIAERRDMRHFIREPLDEEILERLLHAAHLAPSVGFMQPWRFIRILDPNKRQQLIDIVSAERLITAEKLDQRKAEFLKLKVEGISDCAEVMVVTLCDNRDRYIFGRRTMPYMDLASASCAIQNLWLAARAEGVGMGWVSLFEPQAVREVINAPEEVEPIAILCIGPVDHFYPEPMLEQKGWEKRKKLTDVVMTDHWEKEKELAPEMVE